MNAQPIPMILHCPACGAQHIDAPDPASGWDNPPHRSHTCAACGVIWRPADVATIGVRFIETVGSVDTFDFREGAVAKRALPAARRRQARDCK